MKHKIDYLGAGYLAMALTCIILFTSQGGTVLPWSSSQLWFTLTFGLVSLVGFIYEESIAAEPIMPLGLFRQRTFCCCAAGRLRDPSLFGSMTFLPLYLQVVKGSTPSQAGIQLLPLMGGLVVSSIISGRIISKIGKYRFFPIAGTLLAGIAMMLLGTLQNSTPVEIMYVYVTLLGFGLGMVMQVLILAVQNSVHFKYMGVATSGVTLFRSIGGSIGAAPVAIFTNGLHARLAAIIPPGTELPHSLGPKTVHQLPVELRDDYLQAFGGALHMVYLIAACVIVVAFVLALLLEDPLRKEVITQVFARGATDGPILERQNGHLAVSSKSVN